MKNALIFGHGYSAAALTRRLVAEGWSITGTTRSRPDAVAAAGAVPLIWPGADATEALARADAVLISTAPGPDGDPVIAALRPALLAARPKWVGYLSTTVVYGDHGGDWVTEQTPLESTSSRGLARIAAEREWQALADTAGWPLHIFRLAGIYGPGRSALDKLRAGKSRRIIKPGQIFSRIHVEDIGQALAASITQGGPGRVWNLCDDLPCPPQEVIEYAAARAGLPLPPAEDYATAPMTPMARSFYSDSKRVSNAAIKSGLNLRLIFPTYRDGLEPLFQGATEQQPV
ncbi:MAG: SDR family oxidoreductase [Paracoccus sp. (in: a-proteobacteria)]|uniref:SDR family oxidoreductase n=1 Tax=Paracoccus sp. TaxID=267 RepID=UPI0026DED179|nr:SDR family oxidoreductase [Paracoccus sp. (in: a-proteobacteria)]MDO5620826.1 SDR family oxidoreductase [Paracoccus sp. (in: a-proteobacteria)]